MKQQISDHNAQQNGIGRVPYPVVMGKIMSCPPVQAVEVQDVDDQS